MEPAPRDKNHADDATSAALEPLRRQIDSLDERIVALLNERARVVVQIGHLKQQNNAPIYAPDREKLVLDKVRKLNAGPLPNRCLEAVYRELMSGSFMLEKPLRIGFLGPEGTFSHLASTRKFGSSVEHVPLAEIATVFEEVVRGHVDYGLVPVENSIGGGVVDTLDAFLHSSAKICAEVLITVHHNLLANEPWEQVKRIYSKPEVFAQCRRWLTDVAKDRQVEPAASTSAAAVVLSTGTWARSRAVALSQSRHWLNTCALEQIFVTFSHGSLASRLW